MIVIKFAVILRSDFGGIIRIDYKVFMPETPKEKPVCDPVEPDKLEKEDSWEADQKKHDYYYDDSHGYETYEPDPADDIEDE